MPATNVIPTIPAAIFFSYRKKDNVNWMKKTKENIEKKLNWVEETRRKLEKQVAKEIKRDVKVWMDIEDMRSTTFDQIFKTLSQCCIFCAVVSENYLKCPPPWCIEEFQYFYYNKWNEKNIFIIELENYKIPNTKPPVPQYLRTFLANHKTFKFWEKHPRTQKKVRIGLYKDGEECFLQEYHQQIYLLACEMKPILLECLGTSTSIEQVTHTITFGVVSENLVDYKTKLINYLESQNITVKAADGLKPFSLHSNGQIDFGRDKVRLEGYLEKCNLFIQLFDEKETLSEFATLLYDLVKQKGIPILQWRNFSTSKIPKTSDSNYKSILKQAIGGNFERFKESIIENLLKNKEENL